MDVLGIDVGKNELCAHLLPAEVSLTVPNSSQGFSKLLGWAEQHRSSRDELQVVMEATGVYWESCAAHCHAAGSQVSVENPAKIKFFARSLLRRGKTDGMDAEIIAHYGLTMRPAAWQPPRPELVELKLLVREREALLVTLTQERNRQHALNHRENGSETLLRLVEQRIALLQEQITRLEEAMQHLVDQQADVGQQVDLLRTVPGYGFITAVSVVAETAGFAHLENGAQIAAYAGIAPAPFESGSSVQRRGRISKVGNAHLRRAAYLAAYGAKHSKSRMGEFYRHLRKEGKPPKVALTALGRKLLRVGLAVVKSGQPYREDYRRDPAPTT
jgi:transposase